MRKVYFVRHGESEVNAKHVFGSAAHIKLTPKGEAQARTVGRELSVSYPPIDAIISSTMIRARVTAQLIAEELSLPLEKIEFDDRIIEVGCGDFEGKPLTEENILQRDKYLITGRNEHNVESLDEIVDRISSFVEDLKNRPEGVILIVGHGFAGRMIRRLYGGLDPKTPLHQLGNAEIIELQPEIEIKTGELIL